MWELGVGAAVALATTGCARLPRWVAVGMSWLGLAAVAASGLVVTTETAWPGYAAALPALGAAAVIAGGAAAGRGGAGLVLGLPLMRWAGGLSYSLYLWHWPLIAAAVAYWGSDATTTRLLAVAAVSVVPAWLTHVLIENPLRFSVPMARSPRLALSVGANFSLVGVATGLAVVATVGVISTSAPPPADARGARVLASDPRGDPAGAPVDSVGWMTPLPTLAKKDLTVAHADHCVQKVNVADVVRCEYGDPTGTTTVAVVGDSKMTQWIPALVPLAERNGWHVVTYLESGCSFTRATTVVRGVPRTECRRWVDNVVGQLRADRPDWVITSQLQSAALDGSGQSTVDAMVAGLRDVWSTLLSTGSRMAVIADNPDPQMNVFECVEKHPHRLTACAFDRRTAPSAAASQRRAAAGLKGVSMVDLTAAICPTLRCAPVIGNVLVYRETSHLSATYVRTLTPRLAAALTKVGLVAKASALP
jgi:hypothetical protein